LTTKLERRLNRIGFVVIGVCFEILGLAALSQRSHYSSFYGQYIDLGYYHELVGCAVILLGVVCIWLGLRGPRARRG
jgi:hypothetical protein